jgi:L-ribulose-5-phosphate 4-epimerase
MLEQARKQLITICRQVYHRGLSSGAAGNISIRISGSDHVLIKRSGSSFGFVEEADFLVVDMQGNLIQGEGKPSREINFHLGIYSCRPEINAVLHAHPPYAVAFANSLGYLPLVTVSAQKILKNVPNIPYAEPGSTELAQMIIEQFKGTEIKGVTMTNHGTVTVGKDLWEAYYLADYLEDNAKVACAMSQIESKTW